MTIVKTKPAILVAALLCAGCASELKTRPPTDFVWHTVTAQEDLGMIALRYYDNPKAGFVYLQEVNWDRLARGQPVPGEPAPGTRIQVPSKAEFQHWLRDNEKSRGFDKFSSVSTGVKDMSLGDETLSEPRKE
jgi:hypothetical protein